MNNNEDDIACSFTDHITEWILVNNPQIFYQNFIDIDDQKYESEVESLLKYFYKIKNTNNNSNLFYTIIYYWF